MKTLPPLVGECLKEARRREAISPGREVGAFVFLSRYRDNIYISLLNVKGEIAHKVRIAVSALLHSIYGIKLKWEPHGDVVTWGEGALSVQQDGLHLHRKGVVPALHAPEPEWLNWVDASSPHTRNVWASQFPSLLQKSIWYALTPQDIRDNLRSLCWGVGRKGYPSKWWSGTLGRFHRMYLSRVVGLQQLQAWVIQGKRKA